MNELTLIVSRPPPALRSNGGHGNRYETARARKIAKAEAWALTLQSSGLAVADGDTVNIQFTELLGLGNGAFASRAAVMDPPGYAIGSSPLPATQAQSPMQHPSLSPTILIEEATQPPLVTAQ